MKKKRFDNILKEEYEKLSCHESDNYSYLIKSFEDMMNREKKIILFQQSLTDNGYELVQDISGSYLYFKDMLFIVVEIKLPKENVSEIDVEPAGYAGLILKLAKAVIDHSPETWIIQINFIQENDSENTSMPLKTAEKYYICHKNTSQWFEIDFKPLSEDSIEHSVDI